MYQKAHTVLNNWHAKVRQDITHRVSWLDWMDILQSGTNLRPACQNPLLCCLCWFAASRGVMLLDIGAAWGKPGDGAHPGLAQHVEIMAGAARHAQLLDVLKSLTAALQQPLPSSPNSTVYSTIDFAA